MWIIDNLSYCLALFIGLSLGLTGGGGSILTVPVLVYAAGLEPIIATAYSLFIVGVTSLVGAASYFRKQLVNIKLAILFAFPSMFTVWLVRKYIIHAIPLKLFSLGGLILSRDLFLMLLFAIVMLISSLKMIFFKPKEQQAVVENPNYIIAISNGLVVGLISGLVGAGGGFLIVPALVLFMGLSMPLAIGTSLLIISLNSLVGFTGDFNHISNIDWSYLFKFSIIASIGVLLGVYINKYINAERLKKIFGYFVLIMAIAVIIKEIYYS